MLPIIIMGTLLTLGGLASLFLPETMGQPLPQTIEDGELVSLTNPLSVFFKKPSITHQHKRTATVNLNNHSSDMVNFKHFDGFSL